MGSISAFVKGSLYQNIAAGMLASDLTSTSFEPEISELSSSATIFVFPVIE
jgi:hypothetical protein